MRKLNVISTTRKLALFFLLLALGCRENYRATGELGPIQIHIQVVARSERAAREAIAAAFAEIQQVNNLVSYYLESSEISRLNAAPAGERVHLSQTTLDVLRRAQEISELAGGSFDITAAPLIKLWKQTIATGELPDAAALESARDAVGYTKLELGDTWAMKTADGVRVDLGGIAKGFAVDRAIAALKRKGITGALVAIAGDGYALGNQANGRAWRIGIRNPSALEERIGDVLELSDKAYSTSGDYEQYIEIGGVRYAHIIDPRTGQPAHQAASVTIIADDSATADSLATAVSVLGARDGLAAIAKVNGAAGLIITRTEEGLNFTKSPAFDRHVAGNRAGR